MEQFSSQQSEQPAVIYWPCKQAWKGQKLQFPIRICRGATQIVAKDMNHLKKIFTRYFFHFPMICSFVLHLWLPNALTLASRPNLGFNMGLGHFGHPVAPSGTAVEFMMQTPQTSEIIVHNHLHTQVATFGLLMMLCFILQQLSYQVLPRAVGLQTMQSKKKETVVQICRGKCPHYLGKKSVFVLARPIPRVAKPTLIRCHSSLSDVLDLQRFTIYIYQQLLQPSLLSPTQT